jgi:hypothetical protein
MHERIPQPAWLQRAFASALLGIPAMAMAAEPPPGTVVLRGHAAGVFMAAFTPDGTRVVWIGTKQQYGDFPIELEYRLPAKGNTGIFVRAWPEGHPSGADFVEVQLIEDVAFQTTGLNCTGSLFKRIEPSPRPETRLDDWNTAVVRVVGKQVTVTISGVTCINADVDFPRDAGVIGLQILESPVEFRRIRVQDLGGSAAS